MINFIREKWRKAHIHKHHLKINANWRFDKKEFRFYNIINAVPNLIIVGSQKCGTSSLHFYLSEHPDIYMSSPFKEPAYFIFDEWGKTYWQEKGVQINSKKELKLNYMIDDGFIGQKYFGDSSTHYTIGNRVKKYDIVSIIKKETKNPKIIYLIRNPFERMTSAYYHMKKYWAYDKSLDTFINEEQHAIETTQYFRQIIPFVNEFKSNVLLLMFEDLINDTHSTLSKTYSFLELPNHEHINFEIHNKTRPENPVKLSLQSFSKLLPIFNEEKKNIENYFDVTLKWDLSNQTWVEN